MRPIRFLPLTFLAGVHGFILFTPYLVFVLAVMSYRRYRTRLQPAVASVEPLRLPARFALTA